MKETKKSLLSFSDYIECFDEPSWPIDLKIHRYGLVSGNIDNFTAVKTENKYFKLMPGPEFFPLLYRGQTEYHEKCYPAIFRNSLTEIDRLIEIIRVVQFEILLKKHPTIKELDEYKILDCKFKVDYEGLAQHYRFKTPLLDFTRSYEIAMFFARCRYIEASDEYEPLNENCRPGVLYTIDLRAAKKHLKSGQPIDIVGFQALPRPGDQKAFSYRLARNENLNEKPFIQKQIIEHDKEKSERIFEQFDGGNKFFSKNEVIENKVKEIKGAKSLSRVAFDLTYSRYCSGYNKEEVLDSLKKKGLFLEDIEITFTNGEIAKMQREWYKKRNDFYNRIQRRLCSPPQ